MNKFKYQCCFCGEYIALEQITELCSLVATVNWNKEQVAHQEQQMFCHVKCFKSKLAKNIPFYIEHLIE